MSLPQQKSLDYIYRDNKPIAVILNIDVFNEIIERIEDFEDMEYIKELRKKPLKLRSFKSYLAEKKQNV